MPLSKVYSLFGVFLLGFGPSPEDAAPDEAAARARRLFDLGDYPGAERAIEKILDGLPADAVSERAFRTAQLAEVRMFQGIQEAAIKDIESALRLSESPVVRRSAVTVYLRTQHYAEALPHISALLEKDPGDLTMLFARGIVRAKTGLFEDALGDLAVGLRIPAAEREARFELALALSRLLRPADALRHLREILEGDPADSEAVYQASRQLLALRRARTAAQVMAYFESLREAEGPSSRDHHYLMTGKPLEAALERAAKWERLGLYDKVLAEIARARALRPGAPEVEGWVSAFWKRLGLGDDPKPLDLEKAIDPAADEGKATRAARLLLARDPKSLPALRYLVSRTESPSLIVPHLYYLKRLSEADPGNPKWKDDLAKARRAFEGE